MKKLTMGGIGIGLALAVCEGAVARVIVFTKRLADFWRDEDHAAPSHASPDMFPSSAIMVRIIVIGT